MQVSQDSMRFVDSVFLRETGIAPFRRFDASNRMTFSYATAGAHEVTVRWYLMADSGTYNDTTFTIRTAIDYVGEPMNEVLGNAGSLVNLRATGMKHSNVNWHWDLSRVGLGTIISPGDTSIFVNVVRNDTIFLSQIDSAGRCWILRAFLWVAAVAAVYFYRK